MEKIYEQKYLRHDLLYQVPRLIAYEEMRYKPIFGSFSPNDIKWKVYKQYDNKDIIYELDAEPRSLAWRFGRIGRTTSSVAAEAMGLSRYNKDLVSTALQIAAYTDRSHQSTYISQEKLQKLADAGIKNEPMVKLHCEMFHKCQIRDVGLLVPSWKPMLGDSPDGEVLIEVKGKMERWSAEFKAPDKIYRGLEERLEMVAEGADIMENDYSHINPEHYIQCHVHMFCMNTQKCIYHVCDFNHGKYFSQIVPFNSQFWNWCMRRLDYFYKNYLLPITRTTDFPIIPSL